MAHLNVAETVSADWVNTANPWADNEVADALTLSGGTVDNTVIGGSTPAAGSFTTLSATGDVDAAGGYRVPFGFGQADVAASQTAVALDVQGTPGNTEYVMPFAGSIVGISVASNALRTGGTATLEPTVNGTGVGLTTQINAGNTLYNSSTQAKDTDTFSAGDRVSVLVTTDGTWAPTTADFVITVIVEM